MSVGRCLSPAPRSLSLVVLLTLAVTGCASGNAERARREAEVAGLQAQLDALQKSRAVDAREMTKLAEQIKAIDAQQGFLVAEAKESKGELARVQKALAQSDSAVRELRAAPEETERKAAAPPAPGPGGRPSSSTSRETSADDVFAAAMASFRAEEYEQAVLELAVVRDKFPKHSLASTAQYWIGEAHYRQRDYRRALAEFQEVVEGYPRSAQVPEALLKIGLCHRALKDIARTRESWEQLSKDYPGTSAGAEARALLSELGGAARRAR